MASTLPSRLVDELREQQLRGLEDAADSNLTLTASGFGPTAHLAISARFALACGAELTALELLVLCLRFGIASDGLGRDGTAAFLHQSRREVALVEYAIVARLGLDGRATADPARPLLTRHRSCNDTGTAHSLAPPSSDADRVAVG